MYLLSLPVASCWKSSCEEVPTLPWKALDDVRANAPPIAPQGRSLCYHSARSESATLAWVLPDSHKYASASRPLQCPWQSFHKRFLIPSLASGVCSNATLSDKRTFPPPLPHHAVILTLFGGGGGLVIKSFPTLATSWTSLPGFSVDGISQARILGWVAIFFWGSSWPRDWAHISCVSCFGRWILYQLSHQGNSYLIFHHWMLRAGTLYYSLFTPEQLG